MHRLALPQIAGNDLIIWLQGFQTKIPQFQEGCLGSLPWARHGLWGQIIRKIVGRAGRHRELGPLDNQYSRCAAVDRRP